MVESMDTIVRQAYAVNWVAGACMTVLVYNHFLTFKQEVTRIWPTRLSLAKFLFFTNRYVVESIILFNCISASQPHRSAGLSVASLSPLILAHHDRDPQLRLLPAMAHSCRHHLHDHCPSYPGLAYMGFVYEELDAWVTNHSTSSPLGTYHFSFSIDAGGTITLIGLVIQDYLGEAVEIRPDFAGGHYLVVMPTLITPLIVETVLFAIVVSRVFYWWKEGTPTPRILSMLVRPTGSRSMTSFV
ncbi:hypothetical protein NMY22_g19687 [Coprinellus aureogranulatus]|nr:hypothetical protein NMY22_g19687 [Coprinellus aureogranulatus]